MNLHGLKKLAVIMTMQGSTIQIMNFFLLMRNFFNAIDAVRAVYFGKIESWNDEYIKFNGYGNLESLSEYEAEELANDYVDEIYLHDDIWLQYIDDD